SGRMKVVVDRLPKSTQQSAVSTQPMRLNADCSNLIRWPDSCTYDQRPRTACLELLQQNTSKLRILGPAALRLERLTFGRRLRPTSNGPARSHWRCVSYPLGA